MQTEHISRSSGPVPHLTVTNFGPIKEARLDLRPLSIFIGPSNTGKSYLAILLYALHRYFENRMEDYMWGFRRQRRSSLGLDSSDAARNLLDSLADWGNVLTELNVRGGSLQGEVTVPEKLASILRNSLSSEGGISLEDEIARCFGVEAIALRSRHTDSNSTLLARTVPDGSLEQIEHRLSIEQDNVTFQTTIPDGLQLRMREDTALRLAARWRPWEDDKPNLDSERNRNDQIPYFYLNNLQQFLSANLFEPFWRRAFYLPADRTGVMHAHKAVVGAVLENAAMAGIRPARHLPLLSGVMADFLDGLIRMDYPTRFPRRRDRPKEILKICKEIEKGIMEGSVMVKSSEVTKYPEFSYLPTGWDEPVPLRNASSMVSELSPVVLYLRQQVSPGDVMIIEEPESHLHPAMQVQFTRQLAAMVNAGIRVIITTHSEWVLEEFANLVRLSSLADADRAKIDGGKVALKPENVGAWLFKSGLPQRGSRISQIDIDDSGLYPAGFDDVTISLHNNWARISEHIDNQP